MQGVEVSAKLFDILGNPDGSRTRIQTAEDDPRRREPVAIVSYAPSGSAA